MWSTSQSRLSDSQKRAIVTPFLNRSGLDTTDLSNYRPTSNVTFMSKMVERTVAKQPRASQMRFLCPFGQVPIKNGQVLCSSSAEIYNETLNRRFLPLTELWDLPVTGVLYFFIIALCTLDNFRNHSRAKVGRPRPSRW